MRLTRNQQKLACPSKVRKPNLINNIMSHQKLPSSKPPKPPQSASMTFIAIQLASQTHRRPDSCEAASELENIHCGAIRNRLLRASCWLCVVPWIHPLPIEGQPCWCVFRFHYATREVPLSGSVWIHAKPHHIHHLLLDFVGCSLLIEGNLNVQKEHELYQGIYQTGPSNQKLQYATIRTNPAETHYLTDLPWFCHHWCHSAPGSALLPKDLRVTRLRGPPPQLRPPRLTVSAKVPRSDWFLYIERDTHILY